MKLIIKSPLITLTVLLAIFQMQATVMAGDSDTRQQMARFWDLAEERIELENEVLKQEVQQNRTQSGETASTSIEREQNHTASRTSLLQNANIPVRTTQLRIPATDSSRPLIQARQTDRQSRTRSRIGLQILNIDLVGLVFQEKSESSEDSLEGQF